MMLLLVIVTAVETLIARPPEAPGCPRIPVPESVGFPRPPAPPMPMINPLFISSTPPGNEPSITRPVVPVLLELTITPELMVATTFVDWFHPAATASDLKLALVVLLEIVNANWLALP